MILYSLWRFLQTDQWVTRRQKLQKRNEPGVMCRQSGRYYSFPARISWCTSLSPYSAWSFTEPFHPWNWRLANTQPWRWSSAVLGWPCVQYHPCLILFCTSPQGRKSRLVCMSCYHGYAMSDAYASEKSRVRLILSCHDAALLGWWDNSGDRSSSAFPTQITSVVVYHQLCSIVVHISDINARIEYFANFWH